MRMNPPIWTVTLFLTCLVSTSKALEITTSNLPSGRDGLLYYAQAILPGDVWTHSWDQSLAWVDFNGDGPLDLAVTGNAYDPIQNTTRWLATIYRNANQESPEEVQLGLDLSGMEDKTIAWGDYDDNGHLDLAVAGLGWDPVQNATAPLTKIYRNDGSNVYTDIGAGIVGVRDAALAWGDYNGNGSLDLAVAGNGAALGQNSTMPLTRIYRNDGGDVFTDIGAGLVGLDGPSLAWGDYNGDNLLDLALTGSGNDPIQNITGPMTKIYRNNGGDVFTPIESRLLGIARNADHGVALAWGDDNADDRLDLAIAGHGYDLSQNKTGPYARIFINDDSNNFSELPVALGLGNMEQSQPAWSDINGNGRLDLAYSYSQHDMIQNATIRATRLYRNDGNGSFVDINAGITNLASPLLAWGDSSGYGISDLAIMGTDNAGQTLIIVYRNDWSDSDRDGLPDWWEEEYYGGPTIAVASYIPDASKLTNLQKYIADLIPGDDNSIFVFSEVEFAESEMGAKGITIRWPTARQRVYRIYVSTDLTAPWPETPVYQTTGDGLIATYTHTTSDSVPLYFKLTVALIDD